MRLMAQIDRAAHTDDQCRYSRIVGRMMLNNFDAEQSDQ